MNQKGLRRSVKDALHEIVNHIADDLTLGLHTELIASGGTLV